MRIEDADVRSKTFFSPFITATLAIGEFLDAVAKVLLQSIRRLLVEVIAGQ